MPIQSLMDSSQPFAGRRSSVRWSLISVTVHALVIAAFLYHRPSILKSSALPGDFNGHQMLLTYMPGQGAATPNPPNPKPAKPVDDLLPSLRVPKSPPPPAAAPTNALNSNSTTGTDTYGQGDIQIASMLQHPRPSPDLSSLPSGTRGDVIVDIVIDATGRVAKTTVEHGLGYGVDEAVLAIIQKWTFQPATRNGVPIASEQELLFHYERG